MKGKSALIWLGLAGAAGAVLFQTSYEVQNREEQLAGLNRRIVAEQEAIQILKAEWSYLNDLSRLETLAGTHLSLRPTDARQFVASADIVPMRPEPAPAPEMAPPLPPMAGLAPQVAGVIRASVPAPAVHSAAPSAAPSAAVLKAVPASPAKIPAPPAAASEPAAAKAKVQPAVVKTQQQQTLTPPSKAPASKTLAVPANAKPQPPAPPPAHDPLGVMIARLGGNR